MELALVGGSLRPGSVSERVLAACADLAAVHGARSTVLTAEDLDLPLYRPGATHRPRAARELLSALRRADGVIIVTPTYHGGVSGLIKNALDYVEDLAGDTPAYLDGRVVGTVAVGWSEHGAATAVAELRTAVLCLRGWVTPMAVTVNSVPLSTLETTINGSAGSAIDAALRSDARLMRRLEILVGQVVDFAGTRLVTAV
ncbi:NADPH-dependent FMN reductase [Actinokineospora sp. HUAS TT18]|uniref:NADPH-dependent FMN reductase n=1 Tax=Actinokineospora sp. HUAS TT18 TaxID=3447451 RepID=UPI003F524274